MTLERTLYRSLLRACDFGRRPDVFGPYAAPVRKPLNDPAQVRQALRAVFTGDISIENSKRSEEPVNPFAVLRTANNLSQSLYPTRDFVGNVLPIFDYSGVATLPGEIASLRFFEPRYLQLYENAMEASGHFLLRSSVNSPLDDGIVVSCSLMTITESATGDGGTVDVHCTGGPRVSVLDEELVTVNGGSTAPLNVATEWEFEHDTGIRMDGGLGEEEEVQIAKLKASIIERLERMALERGGQELVERTGLPPLDAERFSLWALPFVLGLRDHHSRTMWLACRSTLSRLQHIDKALRIVDETDDI